MQPLALSPIVSFQFSVLYGLQVIEAVSHPICVTPTVSMHLSKSLGSLCNKHALRISDTAVCCFQVFCMAKCFVSRGLYKLIY